MSLDRGRVDGGRGVEAGVARQGLEDAMPDALSAPPIEPVVDRRVRTVLRRTIPPARPGPQRENDARKHPAIIYPMRAAPPGRQMRL